MQFEWDETKRQANITKHDVDFLEAMELLADAPIMLDDSPRTMASAAVRLSGSLTAKCSW